jgi:hypothetical protein
MDAPPRLPPPLYDPRLVADAILFACEHPRRQLYVGGGGYAISLAGKVAPRLTDLAMQAFGIDAQQSPGDAGVLSRRDNLHEPRSEGTIDGAQDANVRKTSFLLQAQKMAVPTPGGMVRAGLNAVADLAEAVDAARYRNRR